MRPAAAGVHIALPRGGALTRGRRLSRARARASLLRAVLGDQEGKPKPELCSWRRCRAAERRSSPTKIGLPGQFTSRRSKQKNVFGTFFRYCFDDVETWIDAGTDMSAFW